jgi:shikimate dehydrogenase
MTDHYAVVGNPVAHSMSPAIHAEFARQTGQDIDYIRLLAPLGGFAACIADFRARGGKGVNVTLPFKHEAWGLATSHVGYALNASAVNTIDFRDGKIIGYNTDGIGMVRDVIENLHCVIQDKRVLLLGAGGATYGVMEPLLREHPEQLVVANRTVQKAVALVAHFDKLQNLSINGVLAKPYHELRHSKFDIVINATSAGLKDEMPPLPSGIFASGALAYDMVYGKHTPFMKFAAEYGAKVSDGTGMLAEQAAESFFVWRGVRPDTTPLIAMLKRDASRC